MGEGAGTRAPGTLRLTAPFLPVGAALFCVQLDFFALNLALPRISDELATPVTDLQWALSGYMIALGASLVPGGRAADVVGRRRVLVIGVALFGAMSLLCGLVSSAPLLIAGRVLQGVGAGLIFPTALSLVANATDPQVRPRIVGALLGLAGVGTALGPVVGGVLAASAGWRWVFFVNVPFAALAIIGARRLPESRDESGPTSLRQLDWWGAVTLSGGLVLVSVAIDDVSTAGLASLETLGPLVAGVALLLAFGVVETRVAAPLVRPSLVRERVFVVLVVAGTVANIGAVVYILSATLDLQVVRGLSSSAAGLLFVFSSVGLAACGPLSGRLAVRFPPDAVMIASLLLSAPALALLAVVGPLPLYVAVLVLCAMTTGLAYSLGQVAIQTVLPPERSAEGTSVFLTSMICVGGMGVVAATAVIEALGDGAVTGDAISTTLLGLAAVLLVVGLGAVVLQRRRRAPAASA